MDAKNITSTDSDTGKEEKSHIPESPTSVSSFTPEIKWSEEENSSEWDTLEEEKSHIPESPTSLEMRWSEEEDFNPADYPKLARKLAELAEEEHKNPSAKYINPNLAYTGSLEDFLKTRRVSPYPYTEAQQSQSEIRQRDEIKQMDDLFNSRNIQEQINTFSGKDIVNEIAVGTYELGKNVSAFFSNIGQLASKGMVEKKLDSTNNAESDDDDVSDKFDHDDVYDKSEYDKIPTALQDNDDESYDYNHLSYQHALSENNHKASDEIKSDSSESDDDREAEYGLIADIINAIKNNASEDQAQLEDDASKPEEHNNNGLGLRRRR